MHSTIHKAEDLLTGPIFYDFDHALDIDGVPHKVVAVHGGDTSTAHYWEGRDPSDILLSVRPAVINAHKIHATGPQIKHMVARDQELTAMPAA